MNYKIGFIGCGNMGSALIGAVAKTLQGCEIAVCDHNQDKTDRLVSAYGVACVSAEEIAKEAEFVVLGVKPQAMQNALAPIAKRLQARKNAVIVTMAAGLSMQAILSFIGKALPVIRIMPNTPVSLGEGMTLYCKEGVSAAQHEAFLRYFSQTGKLDLVSETQIDAGGALAGSGPAFVYLFAEALARGGVECGLDEQQAALYAAQTLKGAAEMLLAYGDPEALRKAVCSPGGTTLAGIAAMEKLGFSDATKAAILGAYARTLELKK